MLNSLKPSYTIWEQRSGSTLAQAMACCLAAPSHYLNQCWLLTSDVLWYSPVSNFTVSAPGTILYSEFENYTFAISHISQGQMSLITAVPKYAVSFVSLKSNQYSTCVTVGLGVNNVQYWTRLHALYLGLQYTTCIIEPGYNIQVSIRKSSSQYTSLVNTHHPPTEHHIARSQQEQGSFCECA